MRRRLAFQAFWLGIAAVFGGCSGGNPELPAQRSSEAMDVGGLEDATPTEDAAQDTFVERDLPSYDYDGVQGPETLFQHGVASGDPLYDRVIVWTRVTPTENGVVDVFYEVALDPEFTQRVVAEWTTTDASRDYTVKIDAATLWENTTFYYRFQALGRTSPIGRTKTAANATTPLERFRFAVVSCSNYTRGYFHAYREIGERADLELVLHLGDYIYEYGNNSNSFRAAEPSTEILTLDDYRRRYATTRTDPDLQEAHRQHPWIVVWDDHETANNSWRGGAENHTEESEGMWEERLSNAYQAWAEWLPVREQEPLKIWRSFRFGDLIDLVMLDTRIWGRDENIGVDGIDDPNRQLLGADQEAWLIEELSTSSARWQILGQQVMMGQLLVGGMPLNTDQWDGYQAARDRFFEILEVYNRTSTVVLTGDIHTSWASELTRNPLEEPFYTSLGVEFVTPGVTSAGFPEAFADAKDPLLAENPHIQWAQLSNRGYIVMDVTSARAQAAWFHYETITEPNTTSTFAQAQSVQNGIPVLSEDPAAAPAPANSPRLAPLP